MIPAYIQQWLHTQLEQLRYTNVRQCFVDISQALDSAPWLSPRADTPRAGGRVLICLQGILESHQVEIWVSTAYPQEPSLVFVDAQPRPVPPGLSISELLYVATQPPSLPPPPPPKPKPKPKPNPEKSEPFAAPSAPATPEKPARAPAVPQKPPKLSAKPATSSNAGGRAAPPPPPPPPKGPPASAPHTASAPRLPTPTQSSRPSSLPPVPAKEGPASPGSLESLRAAPAASAEHPMGRPFAAPQPRGSYAQSPSPNISARAPATGVPAPPQYTSVSPAPHASTIESPALHSRTPQASARHTSTPQSSARRPSTAQSPAPAIDLLSLTDAPLAAVSGERAQTLARLESALQEQAAGLYYQSQLDAQQLAASSQLLAQIETALAREKDSLLRAKQVLLRNIDVLEQSTARAEELAQRAAAQAPPESIADLVQVAASDRAVVEADSGSRAIDDLLRVLPKALDAGSISLHVYLRLVRQYAREQFSHRHALLQRRPQPPKPPAKH